MLYPLAGDVILYPVSPHSALSSRLVAVGEWLAGAGKGFEPYSHATILSSVPGFEYGYQWPRSGHFPIDATRDYEVWRIGDPSSSQRERILRWCQEHQGEWYNMLGLLTGGLLGLKHTAVCSQGVGRAYASAHIHISAEGQRLLSPNAIRDYPGATLVHKYSPPQKR